MSGFGENLRAQRLARGIKLGQISEETNIGVRFLQAIEDEQFHLLPGGVFNVSFVRQYAAAVDLDQEETLDAFLQIHPAAELNLEEHFWGRGGDQHPAARGCPAGGRIHGLLSPQIAAFCRRSALRVCFSRSVSPCT